MKVQIVRMIIGGCTTFLVVYCSVYAMGILSASLADRAKRSEQKNASLSQSAGEAELNKNVTRVASHETSVPVQSQSTSRVSQPDMSWFQGTQEERNRFEPLLRSRRAPALAVSQWTNTTPLNSRARAGKIVVLSFWSTWCEQCLKSVDFNNEVYRHFKHQDVTFIGICSQNGSEDMAKIVKSKGIQYPVAIDDFDDKTVLTYGVREIPSYFIIDRTGQLRFADIKRDRVDDAVEYLLSNE